MTWQEKIDQLKTQGKLSEASRVFAFSCPNASYVQKMRFADDMYEGKAYKEALAWYEECIGAPVADEYAYLTETGCKEKASEETLAIVAAGDGLFLAGRYKPAAERYLSVAKESDYATTKAAECYFKLEDFTRAKDIYRELAQKTDDGYFAFMLGECYMRELANEYSYEHALYWYTYALDRGCAYAYYPLGLAYEYGYGTEKDIARAEALYRKGTEYAIDRDNCYCKLGNLYYARGEYEKARECYEKAARLNNARALLNLAIGHFNRDIRGLERREAKCLLAKAAALGNARAVELYRSLKNL